MYVEYAKSMLGPLRYKLRSHPGAGRARIEKIHHTFGFNRSFGAIWVSIDMLKNQTYWIEHSSQSLRMMIIKFHVGDD